MTASTTPRVFLAATGQNRGKTTTSLGLAAAIRDRGLRLGFVKPVGQRYLVVDGTRADEDAVLMSEVFELPDALNDMSPVTLPRGFTSDYIMGRITEDLDAQVLSAFERVADDKDLVVIEGTGHAGVGAVVGLSNARVAAMLGAPVIIVSEGGVGRPIDEIVLNLALFAAHGVEVIGAVVNKVDVQSHPHLPGVLARGLEQHDVELLGCIPYSEFLANPSLEKTHAADTQKIATIIELVGGALDVDSLLTRLGATGHVAETRGEAGRGHPPASHAPSAMTGPEAESPR